MSGIVAIVNEDGRSLDPLRLRDLTAALAARGPDGMGTWTDGIVGLGHTLLRTTDEARDERQPWSLDGQVWATADLRLDDRDNLARQLGISPTVPDVHLLLAAYDAWGESCVDHLLGDFAFVLWDGRRQRLFAARDHFGVKPFFYAQVGGSLVLSNTLGCVRQHPAVSARLNELAIADFLLFGGNQEVDTTAWADIQRLPAAHALTWSRDGLRVRRYWKLPTNACIRYRRPDDYLDHFRAVLQAAVADRLRTRPVAISLSGGVDSTTVAAAARRVLGAQPPLHATTVVYDRLFRRDRERHYAGRAADALGLPITFFEAAGAPFQAWEDARFLTEEPCDNPYLAITRAYMANVAATSQVLLTGHGGDAVFAATRDYYWDLFRRGKVVTALGEVAAYTLAAGHFPPLALRSRLRRYLGWQPPRAPLPDWLAPEFAKRLHLAERWQESFLAKPGEHPTRPEAFQSLQSSFWPALCEEFDPAYTRQPVEVRHPLLDRRVVEYLLALPPMPWFANKDIARRAYPDLLPKALVRRRKVPLQGDLLRWHARRGIVGRLPDRATRGGPLSLYVNVSAIPGCDECLRSPAALWARARIVGLDLWLQNLPTKRSQGP